MLLESDELLSVHTITDLSEDLPLLVSGEVSSVLFGNLADNALELSLGHWWFPLVDVFSIAVGGVVCDPVWQLVDWFSARSWYHAHHQPDTHNALRLR